MKQQCSLVLLAVLGACAGGPRAVPVEGADTELVKLAGTWQGTYEGHESGRSGPVSFDLRVGEHSAEGEVRMAGTTPLKIEFVRFNAGQVRGTMAPYTDPSCSCQVETTFVGTRAGEAIDGRFEVKVSATGQLQTGSWHVQRVVR